MRKLTFKILSVLLILLLTLTNMVFIVSYMLGSVKTYAAMENLETQTNETNHQNVSFKAYFLEEPNKEVHSGELDINSAKDLYFQMEVKEKGYLKNAQVQLESIKGETNFIFSDSESNMIQELTDKNIKFKQIIILGIPIVILAMPLIYLILLNRGYVSETRLGIFTIPKLPFHKV